MFGRTEVDYYYDELSKENVEERTVIRYRRCTITGLEALSMSALTGVIGYLLGRADILRIILDSLL